MSTGRLLPWTALGSAALGISRGVQVRLPASYDLEPRRRYPVLYLHDGQNVFSAAGEHACFGWGSWELDRTADQLAAAGRMREILMVAVDNSGARYREYRGRLRPAGASTARRPAAKAAGPDNARFDAYATFLIRELKPWVDREFRTLKTPAHTGVMGSSLGGLCSLALAWDHPRVFGRAACLSGSFQVERRHFLLRVLRAARGPRKALRLYLDSGVMDDAGDDDGRRDTAAVADELRRLGWKDGRTLLHFTDPRPFTDAEMESAGLRWEKWEEARRSQHNEFYWRLRAWRALEFLFPPG